ncbi:hypothetical protein [Mycobacterium kansasii]|uniref:Uncharacterized protein n=1 Tax=Mycobacterium kansasii TaxID=1768 RepID=A0A1V3XHI0_MYCKA|nr:hypothetical protein BZL30_1975 [Mycobacterium kansasii]
MTAVTRTLPRHTQRRQSNGTAGVYLELTDDPTTLTTLLVITDSTGMTHCIEIGLQEADRICDDLNRVTSASPQQREVWQLELLYSI